MTDSQAMPPGEPALKTVAMPADANSNGDIFGGWVLAQMDLAGGVVAHERAKGRVATVAVDAMEFRKPVAIGDVVSCWGHVSRVGTTSLTVQVEAWARRLDSGESVHVTSGRFTYVAIGPDKRPRKLP